MRISEETKQRTERQLLAAIEHAANQVVAGANVDTWSRAALDLAVAYRAVTHYDDAPIGLGIAPPAKSH
jgi:hypothetical protein